MELSIQGLFHRQPPSESNQVTSTRQPEITNSSDKNIFLEKLNPTLHRPNSRVLETSSLRWNTEVAGAILSEMVKAIPRANITSTYDTLSIPAGLTTMGNIVAKSASWLAKAPTLQRALGATTLSVAALTLIPIVWGGIFKQVHHKNRKNENNTQDASSLTTSRDKKELSFETKQAINDTSSQLSDEYPDVSPEFIKALTNETALGNWQVNHAFDKFNSASKGGFTAICSELKQSLPLCQRIPLEQALQKADFQKVQPLIKGLPTTTQNKILELFDERLIRNLACFASRALREQRSTATEFEAQYMSQWLKEYDELHPNQNNTPINTKTVIDIMQGAMDSLGWKGVLPLLNIEVSTAATMPISPWPKKLERQWMRELNAEHSHRLHNAENIPQNGRAIVAFNHSLFTLDIGMGLEAIREQLKREPTMVIDIALTVVAGVNTLLHSAGYRVGDRESFASLLTNERLMAVAPGGTPEALKPYEEANQLYWERAKGFVRTHATTGAPIISVLSPQADQLRKNKLPPLARNIQDTITKYFRVPILPPIMAPREREKIRVDHFATPAFEAPPNPVNNVSGKDPRFFHHVDKLHANIVKNSQSFLENHDETVRAETLDNSYPMAQLS